MFCSSPSSLATFHLLALLKRLLFLAAALSSTELYEDYDTHPYVAFGLSITTTRLQVRSSGRPSTTTTGARLTASSCSDNRDQTVPVSASGRTSVPLCSNAAAGGGQGQSTSRQFLLAGGPASQVEEPRRVAAVKKNPAPAAPSGLLSPPTFSCSFSFDGVSTPAAELLVVASKNDKQDAAVQVGSAPGTAGPGVAPVENKGVNNKMRSPAQHKAIYCIRHGTSWHNVAFVNNHFSKDVFFSPRLHDSPLMKQGHLEAQEFGLKSDFAKNVKDKQKIDLVLVSPLSRAIQTLSNIWKDQILEFFPENFPADKWGVADAEDEEIWAWTSEKTRMTVSLDELKKQRLQFEEKNKIRFVATETLLEYAIGMTPNVRQETATLKKWYPWVDFETLVEQEEKHEVNVYDLAKTASHVNPEFVETYHLDGNAVAFDPKLTKGVSFPQETKSALQHRIQQFKKLVLTNELTQQAKQIAVVAHSGILQLMMFGEFGERFHKDPLKYENAELPLPLICHASTQIQLLLCGTVCIIQIWGAHQTVLRTLSA
ncbi:unnamed protein product [Amoebophrya sp. A120]|nr:unnamed protein product [Amoebophrya sp. A120]|eukprot:GSA120T00007101001.1